MCPHPRWIGYDRGHTGLSLGFLFVGIVGGAGTVVQGEPGALFGGLLEQAYRAAVTLTFGGGVNEVQRDIIAAAGLRLPRAQRRN